MVLSSNGALQKKKMQSKKAFGTSFTWFFMPKKIPGTIANVPGVLYAHLVRTCRSVELLQSGMRDTKLHSRTLRVHDLPEMLHLFLVVRFWF